MDADRAQRALAQRIGREEHPLPPVFKNRGVFSGQTLRHQLWYVAAALVVCVIGVIAKWNGVARHDILSMPSAVSTYTTLNGERANITLPDGSTVALNVASRLEVPVDYAAGNHTMHLMGEALFTVMHHEGMPVTVIAGATTARVLGTSFAVRHYATDTTTVVAVRDGKVAVGNVVVTAARLVEVAPHGAQRLRSADPAQFGFTTGVLKLSSMPLSRAVTELDRWYAADIRLGDTSFAKIPIKGKFLAGSLSQLAEILAFQLDARVVRDGRVLTLYSKAK